MSSAEVVGTGQEGRRRLEEYRGIYEANQGERERQGKGGREGEA
jgi:hypothetical protein